MSFNTKNILVFSVLLSLLSLGCKCNKRFGCEENVYNFELDIRAYPDKDSISIGDTIWFEINALTTLTDVQTGRVIDYSGAANLGTFVDFSKLIDSIP